jgi:DNA-binding NarL/FixJ family response regulator
MKVILADDHAMMRAGLRALLESSEGVEIVAETGDGREAVALIASHQPDIAILDISMPGLNGIEVAGVVRDSSPRTRILMLSMHAEEGFVARALRAGVSGYLLKDSAPDELNAALRALSRGDSYLSPAISRQGV